MSGVSEIARYACPVLLSQAWQIWLFLLIPGILAALGARLTEGSWMRIPGAAAGAALRDLSFLLLAGLIPESARNPDYAPYYSWFLAYLCASGAAVMSCLSPYRGWILPVMSAIGAFAAQFVLLYTSTRETWAFLLILLRG
ncbi:hypothetical protein DYH09_14255 [bacterium CPR1]|nr:hypothetical protein [bacterium CPR1]